jgi:hypothetical protein
LLKYVPAAIQAQGSAAVSVHFDAGGVAEPGLFQAQRLTASACASLN